MAHIEDRWEKVVQGARVRTDRHGKGERWRARYFDPNGQERARTFARKTDAEKFLAGVESDKSRGLYVDPSAGRITVGQYAATWQAAQVHRRTTEAALDSHLRNHILRCSGTARWAPLPAPKSRAGSSPGRRCWLPRRPHWSTPCCA